MKKKKTTKDQKAWSPPKKIKHPSGFSMMLDENFVVVEFEAEQKKSLLDKNVKAIGWKLADSEFKKKTGTAGKSTKVKGKAPSGELNDTETKIWFQSGRKIKLQADAREQAEKKIKKKIKWLSPVYKVGKGKAVSRISPLPNVILIRDFSEKKNNGEILENIKALGLTLNEKKSQYLYPYTYYELENNDIGIFAIQEQLVRKWKLEVRFEFMPMIKPTTFIPNDTLFANQWNMTIIHAGDIPLAGWDLTTGNENVVIAILDEGCDLSHPDLNFFDSGINLGSMAGDGRPTGNHGTACAGIAAALIDNNEGIAGVAGSCLILPIAFQNWTDVEVAAGIRYATDNGAHIVSMSFGQYAPGDGRGPSGWDFDLIDPAIEYAIEEGVTLIAATGNENIGTFNRYPARHHMVIAVGASDQNDNRKSPASPDGEGWGSNFASGVSVVAPGVLIPTTDRQGNVGYVNGDYDMTFNGTSSATPHVAGLAGLIKSVCPTNSPTDIRNILERTCDKVGTVAYNSSSDNGTTNQEMGHGRINASEAVKEGFLYMLACLI